MKASVKAIAAVLLAGSGVGYAGEFGLEGIKAPELKVEVRVESVAPGVPAPVNKRFVNDIMLERAVAMTRMSSNSLKVLALSLGGLVQVPGFDAPAPPAYTRGVADVSESIEDSVRELELALRSRDGLALRNEISRMSPKVQRLRKLAASIEGNENYDYWGGRELTRLADSFRDYLSVMSVNGMSL